MNNEIISSVDDLIIPSHTGLKKTLYLANKRFVDVIVGFIGCVLLVPIFILVKLAYILTGDFAPIIYKQKRIGLNGEEFDLYKFRSMCVDAPEKLKKILAENEDLRKEYEEFHKLSNDPRITKVGKIIRHASIDETPQFINVLKGDMSIIGNRPYLPREIKDMGLYYNDIIKTKPGLTGYWQVNGRSNTTFLRRLQLEREYSNIANLWLDIKIFFKSLPAVLLCRGAE